MSEVTGADSRAGIGHEDKCQLEVTCIFQSKCKSFMCRGWAGKGAQSKRHQKCLSNHLGKAHLHFNSWPSRSSHANILNLLQTLGPVAELPQFLQSFSVSELGVQCKLCQQDAQSKADRFNASGFLSPAVWKS